MGYLKGKSALMIFLFSPLTDLDKFPQMNTSAGRHFCAKGYYVSTIGLNAEVIKEYIANQEEADVIEDKAGS